MGNCSITDKRVDHLMLDVKTLKELLAENTSLDSSVQTSLRAELNELRDTVKKITACEAGRVCIAQYAELEQSINKLAGRVEKLERDVKKMRDQCGWM